MNALYCVRVLFSTAILLLGLTVMVMEILAGVGWRQFAPLLIVTGLLCAGLIIDACMVFLYARSITLTRSDLGSFFAMYREAFTWKYLRDRAAESEREVLQLEIQARECPSLATTDIRRWIRSDGYSAVLAKVTLAYNMTMARRYGGNVRSIQERTLAFGE